MRYFVLPHGPEITAEFAELMDPSAYRVEPDQLGGRMRNCMIDIETMGVHTSESLILSFAAVGFELELEAPRISQNQLKLSLLVEPQMLAGRKIDPDTQKWWSQQTPAAAEHWMSMSDKIHPSYVDHMIKEYLKSECEGPTTQIWANGIVFDLGNLENLILHYKHPLPWMYNTARDARTIYQLCRQDRNMPIDLKFESHDPLADCLKQIWRLWERYPFPG